MGNAFHNPHDGGGGTGGPTSQFNTDEAILIVYEWMMYDVRTMTTTEPPSSSSGETKKKKKKMRSVLPKPNFAKLTQDPDFQRHMLTTAREMVMGQRVDVINMMVAAKKMQFQISTQHSASAERSDDSSTTDTSSSEESDIAAIRVMMSNGADQLANVLLYERSQASRRAFEGIRSFNLQKEHRFNLARREESMQNVRDEAMFSQGTTATKTVSARRMSCSMVYDPFTQSTIYAGGGGSTKGRRALPVTAEMPYDDPGQHWRTVLGRDTNPEPDHIHAHVEGQQLRHQLSQTSRQTTSKIPFRF